MLRTLIIGPDTDTNAKLLGALGEAGAEPAQLLGGYPETEELGRILREIRPAAVFIDTASVHRCTWLGVLVETLSPGTQAVAIGSNCSAETLMSVMQSGIREFVAAPFDRACLRACLRRIEEQIATAAFTESLVPDARRNSGAVRYVFSFNSAAG